MADGRQVTVSLCRSHKIRMASSRMGLTQRSADGGHPQSASENKSSPADLAAISEFTIITIFKEAAVIFFTIRHIIVNLGS